MTATRKRLIAGAISALIAVACVLLAFADMNARVATERDESLARYGGEQTQVLVMRRDLAVGAQVGADDIEQRNWISALLPEGALYEPEQVVGKTVKVPLYEGEPVLERKVGDISEGIDVPDGRCAVTVPVDDVTALGGSLQPGTNVDVYQTTGATPTLLATGIPVLATSNTSTAMSAGTSSSLFSAGAGIASVSWATLAVEPENVQEMVAAASSDALFLVLPGAGAASDAAQADGGKASAATAAAPSVSSGASSAPSANHPAAMAAASGGAMHATGGERS